MPSDDWFAVEPLGDDAFLVAEPGHVNCYLVVGRDRAVLVDTGLGLGNVRAAVESLVPCPVLVVNTHAHSDHRGANWRFDEVAAHPLAAATLTAEVPYAQLAGYLDIAREAQRAYARFSADDQRFFHVFSSATRPRPLPSDADTWRVPAGPAPRPLADGERIDLGGRDLTVLHTPGHSPDSLCLLDERGGRLFAGDTIITGDFWAHTPDADLPRFADTLRRLRDDLGPALQVVHPAHSARYAVGPEYLSDVAAAFEDIVEGTSSGEWGTDLLGRAALRHDFGDFAVLRPSPARESVG